MKRVKVDTIEPPADPASVITSERMYTVSLGNSVIVRFSSRRRALEFQADATRFVTDVLHQVNLLLSEAYALHRLAWPYFNAKDESCADLVRSAERALEQAAIDSHGPNRVYFKWKHLQGAIENIRALAIALEKMYVEKSYAVPRVQANVLLRRCNALADELRDYGTDVDTSTGFRPSPYT